jgi:sarcosine oxidase subunit delta
MSILIPCPWCGARDAEEFGYVGEVVARPDPRRATPEEWREYLYLRRNVAGWTTERWYHRAGCRRHLVVERHTVSNAVRLARDAAGQGTER